MCGSVEVEIKTPAQYMEYLWMAEINSRFQEIARESRGVTYEADPLPGIVTTDGQNVSADQIDKLATYQREKIRKVFGKAADDPRYAALVKRFDRVVQDHAAKLKAFTKLDGNSTDFSTKEMRYAHYIYNHSHPKLIAWKLYQEASIKAVGAGDQESADQLTRGPYVTENSDYPGTVRRNVSLVSSSIDPTFDWADKSGSYDDVAATGAAILFDRDATDGDYRFELIRISPWATFDQSAVTFISIPSGLKGCGTDYKDGLPK